ncbi:MAG: glycosyltransferase, partial [Candidatus Omnitrophica bacterium]|nr:glycosyltransferase [Candidatus Omnitrophota bacterium]
EGDITDLLRLSMVGVCPTTKIADFFPNKAFLYLSAGLPVISSFQGDLKEIIKERQIGFYYPPNDVDVLVDCIDKLHKDKEFYVKMSANVRNVFDEMFDADKIYEEYAEHVERIALNAKASV